MSNKRKFKESLLRQVDNLSQKQQDQLTSILLDASLCFENGGNYTEIFRQAKHRHLGRMKTMLELLETADHDCFDEVSGIMANSDSYLVDVELEDCFA